MDIFVIAHSGALLSLKSEIQKRVVGRIKQQHRAEQQQSSVEHDTRHRYRRGSARTALGTPLYRGDNGHGEKHREREEEYVLHEKRVGDGVGKAAAEARKRLEKVAEGGQALEIEYAESGDNDDLGVDMRGDFWHFLHAFLADERFYEDEKSVVKSPENEVPACAVPKTRAEPYEEKSAVLAASAKYRHIEQVVAEKASERDVPSLPKLGYALADEGIVEVFVEMEAENASQADGDVGIAREIEVVPKGNKRRAVPCAQRGEI